MFYLSKELETYERIGRSFLMEHAGQYGYGEYGLNPFLVKRVLAIEAIFN